MNCFFCDDFIKTVRQLIESGINLEYQLTIKKSNQPGFVVALNYVMKSPKKDLGTFIRLL